jgi:iron complex transport system substrate-binding protein
MKRTLSQFLSPLCLLLSFLLLISCGQKPEPSARTAEPTAVSPEENLRATVPEGSGSAWLPPIYSPELLSAAPGTRRLRDSSGRIVEVPRPLRRVVSLAPNLTEMIYALDRGELLVGRTEWCSYPAPVLALPSVGDILNPSLEAILSLSPDLVLASTHVPLEIIGRLDSLGIARGILSAPDSFEGVYQVIAGAAAFLDAEEEGEALTRDFRLREALVRRETETWTRWPRVYYVVSYGTGGDWTAGGDTFIHDLIHSAGGANIAGDLKGWTFSVEKLLEADPDLILLNQGLKNDFCHTEPYRRLRAVRQDQVYELPEDIIVRQGPRLIEGLELLHEIFKTALAAG